MKVNASSAIKSFKKGLVKHSPEILTGIGIAGMICSTILAVGATPKALTLLEEAKAEKDPEVEETKIQEVTTVVKATWPCYIPAAVTGIASISCLIFAQKVNLRRNAVLATAYNLSAAALREYREQVIDTIGEKKETEIKDKLVKKKIQDNPISNNQVLMTNKGEAMFYDCASGRYFKSDMQKIKKSINDLNYRLMTEMYLSLNEFYYEIGLPCTELGNELGWNLNDGMIEPTFSGQITDDGDPCIALFYTTAPRYDYTNLH